MLDEFLRGGGEVLDLDSGGWGAGSKAVSRVGRAGGF